MPSGNTETEKMWHYKKILLESSEDSPNKVFVHTFDTPVGEIIGVADEKYLYIVAVEKNRNVNKYFNLLLRELECCCFVEKENNILRSLREQLTKYFEGKLLKFELPIKTFGSDFQKEVWTKLQDVPFGTTLTYGDLAKTLGKDTSYARAVGSACGANAHLIVIPCHRIVAAGSIGGFSIGKNLKEWLIDHENKYK